MPGESRMLQYIVHPPVHTFDSTWQFHHCQVCQHLPLTYQSVYVGPVQIMPGGCQQQTLGNASLFAQECWQGSPYMLSGNLKLSGVNYEALFLWIFCIIYVCLNLVQVRSKSCVLLQGLDLWHHGPDCWIHNSQAEVFYWENSVYLQNSQRYSFKSSM